MKALTALLFGALVAGQAPDANVVRDRLDAYLLKYEPELSTLVAEELLIQRDGPSHDAFRMTALPTKDRRLVSEVAFISLPGGVGWLGIRRALRLNGNDLPDAGPSLGVLLTDADQGDYDQARLLLAESARLNLGLPRTTNLPNLPLEFLHPRNRRRFTHRIDGTEKLRGLETTRLVLNEAASPTMIQRPEGGDMTSLVTAWVETTTGRLIRAQVKTRDARIGVPVFDAVVWVDFRPDQALGLLVPFEMKEEFYAGRFREGTGVAKYSKYRKFQSSGRIVPPPPAP
ncbi:MAG: hypothetical protein WC815_19750 [Vicinamibacterales bacterium]|jgi:hypothetical protein